MHILSPGYRSTNVAALYVSAGGGGSLLLDSGIAAAANGYSLRKLRTAYAGSAIKVRRSSDNATQDIGFSGNDLDTTSLASFVGANSGYIDTWYDQVGSANLVSASSGVQPRIVNAGALDTKNSKPSMVLDGTDDTLSTTTTALIGASQFTVSAVASSTGGSRLVSFADTIGGSDYGGPLAALPLYREGSSLKSIRFFTETTGGTITDGQLFSTFALWTSTQQITTFDGTAGTPASFTEAALGNTNPRMAVGSNAANFGEIFAGTVSEVIVWTSALGTGDRATLVADTKSYWGTP